MMITEKFVSYKQIFSGYISSKTEINFNVYFSFDSIVYITEKCLKQYKYLHLRLQMWSIMSDKSAFVTHYRKRACLCI